MTDTLKPINTNELRDYADRISNPYSQLILDAASELDATRTERNILRAALTPPAAVEDGELRRLMAEATPGPWVFVDLRAKKEWEGEQSYSIAVGDYLIDDTKYYPSAPSFADAALIVAAINALPGLMAERDRMKEALEPSGETKAAYMGEVKNENGSFVSWTTIKEIMSMIRARAVLGEQP